MVGSLRVFLASFLLIFAISGCGYKPTTDFTKENIGEKIYIDVKLDKAEPENGVYVRDELIEAIYDRLGASVVPTKEQSDSTLTVWYTGTDSDAVKLRFKLVSLKGTYDKTVYVSTEKRDADEYIDVGKLSHRVDTLSANLASAVDEFVAYVASLRGE